MAIIYTYPTKATPNANDLILISDSQDSNKTKQVTVASLPGGSGSGVSSVTSANTAITVADSTTTPVLTSVAYSGGTGIGHVPTGGDNTKFLRGDATWVAITDNDTTIDTKNGGSSVANPTTSLDFATALTATSAPGGVVSINFSGGLRELSDVSYTPGLTESSLYIATVPSNAGSQTGNTTMGSGAAGAITTGENNTIIGAIAGNIITTGAGNVIIGRNADTSAAGNNNSIAIGSSSSSGDRGLAVGSSTSAGASGIALGFNATALANELAIGNITTVTVNADGETPGPLNTPRFLPIKIWNGSTPVLYYIPLYQ